MFSKEMKIAVDDVQQCIKTCNSIDNISMIVTENITKYLQYIEELDPTNIVFDKCGIFANMRIKGYWQKVVDYYPSLENLLDKLSGNATVLFNTINTLHLKKRRFNRAKETFRKLLNTDLEVDTEYMQQSMVVDNTEVLLLNTITEYDVLYKKVNSILAISKQVFDTALLIAQSTYKLKVRTTDTITGIADVAIYKRNYSELLQVLA